MDFWFFIEVLIGGLLSGVMYSLVALGFVLIFKASGVFNFTSSDLLKLALAGNIVAFIGVLIGGYLNDKFSSKKIILFLP